MRAAVTAKAKMWARMMATRLAGNKEGKGKGDKGKGIAMRMASIEEGKGSKAMACHRPCYLVGYFCDYC
jgi:hypothetical protein